MIHLVNETDALVVPREALLDRCFGPDRFAKTCELIRRGRLPAGELSFAALDGARLVGTVRLWHIDAGTAGPALLLGPLGVAPELQGRGIGRLLMERAVADAAVRGHRAVLLVGDAPYYARFGFSDRFTGALEMPGPVERARFLARELVPGALIGGRGMVVPTGLPEVVPLPAVVPALAPAAPAVAAALSELADWPEVPAVAA